MSSETFAEGNLKIAHHFPNAVRHACVAAGGPCLPLGSEWKWISSHFHAPDHPKQLDCALGQEGNKYLAVHAAKHHFSNVA